MTPTKELKAKLQPLFNENNSQLICEAWDINPDELENYICINSLTTSSQASTPKTIVNTGAPSGFNPQRSRHHHNLTNFG